MKRFNDLKWGRKATSVVTASMLMTMGAMVVTSSPSGAASKAPISIGSLETVTGPLAFYGVPEANAIKLAVDLQNAKGGVNGHKLVLHAMDPAGSTSTAVTETQQLIEQDHVKVFIGGGTSSGIAEAINPMLTHAGIFFASGEADPGVVNPISQHPTTFQATLSSSTVVTEMLKFLESKGIKDVAWFSDTSAYAQGGLVAAQYLAANYGIQINGFTYDPTVTDLTPQLTQASQKLASDNLGKTAYVSWTPYPTGVTFMQNIGTLGLNKTSLVMQGFTYSNATLMGEASTSADGVYVAASKVTVASSLPAKDPQRATLAAFSKAYQKAYNSPISIYAAEAYDAAEVAIQALVRTKGSTNARAMAKADVKTPMVGVLGTYKYSAKSHYGLNPADVFMTQWNGTSFVLQK